MAWWNKPAGSLTPSVSVDRVAAWFTSHSYTYELDRDEGAVYSGFDGVSYMFKVASDPLFVIHGRYLTTLPTDEQTVERVRAVARRVADSRIMPAVYLVIDEHGLGLHAEATSSTGAGLNDEQFAGVMDFLIGGVDGAITEILAELDLPSPAQALDAPAPPPEPGQAEGAGAQDPEDPAVGDA